MIATEASELTAVLDEIRGRYLRRGKSPGDIPVLLAEVVKLRSELEQARTAAAAARADERARIRSLLPYNVNCCEGFPAAVADLINEHGDSTP